MKINKFYYENFYLVENFLSENFSSPTHWPDWNLAVSRHYGSNFYYYCAWEEGEVIGICPVHEERSGMLRNLYSGQYHYIPYGGWLFKKEHEFNSFPLRYNQAFSGFNFPINNNLRLKEEYRKFQTLVIDLNYTYEECYLNFNRNTKRNICKALNNNVSIIINNDINFFFPYYKESSKSKGLGVMEASFFFDLMKSLKNISIDILWAIKNNIPLAYLVIIYDKTYSFSWLTHNMQESGSFGQGHLLHAEAIKLSKEKGCKYFDLCYIEKERLPNIYKFKKGFADRELEVPMIVQKPLTYKIINRIKKCF